MDRFGLYFIQAVDRLGRSVVVAIATSAVEVVSPTPLRCIKRFASVHSRAMVNSPVKRTYLPAFDTPYLTR